jgi:uncharacterized protein (TIGR00369 family)
MKMPNPKYIQELIQIVNSSSFPSHMSMRLTAIDIDTAEVEMDITPNHFQAYGIVHGGVLATLIDTATFWSVYMRIPEDAGLVNIDLKLNYLEPVKKERLLAKGHAIRSGNSISYAEAHVFNTNGNIVAHGTSSLMTLPGKSLKINSPKFLGKGVRSPLDSY